MPLRLDGKEVTITDLAIVNGTRLYGPSTQVLEVNKSAGYGGIAANTWSATAGEASRFVFQRSKSATVGTQTVVASGSSLGSIEWYGSDGTNFEAAAAISAQVDTTPGNNDMPGRLMFYTTPDGSATLAERMRLDSVGRLLIGAAASYGRLGQLFEANCVSNYGGAAIMTWSATTDHGPQLDLKHSRGAAAGTYTALQSGDTTGALVWWGADATQWVVSAAIDAQVDGTPGANDMPGRIRFLTTADGASSLTERMRLDSVGRLLINQTAAYGTLGELLEISKSANYGGLRCHTWSATAAQAPRLLLARSKSATIGTQEVVADGDAAGLLGFQASDGTGFENVAQIRAEVDGAPGNDDMPGRLLISTTPDGSATMVERLRITQAGYFGFGTQATPDQMVEFAQVETVAGAVTDGYAAALRSDPGYTAAAAQTVTRHNYWDIQDVSVAGEGPAAVTDACVMRFDAAAGTHKATVGATTKVTVTAVQAWVKVNINGTIHYIPAYTSTTA